MPPAPPNYAEHTLKLGKFFKEFEQDGVLKYESQLQEVANRSQRVIEVSIEDVASMDVELAQYMRMNTRRYTQLLGDAIEAAMPEADGPFHETDVLDVLLEQRLKVLREVAEENQGGPEPADNIPNELKRRFEVRIVGEGDKHVSLRSIKSAHIGHLVNIRAMVARSSDVKPMAKVITYTCEECGYEAYQEVTGRNFMPMDKCKGPKCVQYNNNAKLLMQTRGSKFIKFQEVKVQELPDQVPTGHIPRMMTVHLTGELTRSCGPGDEILISGIFLPMPYTGYKAMKAGLTADTFLEATSVKRAKQRYQDFHITQEMRDQIEACEGESNTYGKLAASIAPEIFGHEDVKKALLLQLVGGVDRSLNDGMRIRGDMHVCLMGDPGVAKSQLLKHVARLAPRGVYTTGKGSSGVGLTAAVTKDQFTGEMMLEGGALVLADQGICCIDEFDKMEDSDRTAIHEVMEQQTVSIAKAGITTSLNARTCVLAAANPAYGRYNLRRSPSENINLPQALLSRFDILFLLMDRVNPEMDYNLAKHVTYVHQFKAAPEVDRDAIFDAGFLRAYIAKARSIDPHVPKSLSEYITSAYISMRCDEEPSDSRNYFFTTARTLLSILRLSQALARLRFAQEVASADVDEAIRLMYESKRSLFDEAVPGQRSYDPSSSIFDIARNLAAASDTQVLRVSELETRAVMKGFTAKQLRDCIQTYADLNIWQLEDSDQQLRIV
eukprot:CAMPEP_0180133258 /NCGR_PEP_ID=MMETSP0986-20121125/9440_1 /TAXON_ID=697907 /ORGANISM="non described non described, Strain CCMP2293" /LENGTH=721 /DNA_ID=CAMNT_0022073355 /DNA_START=88 /DNA_END=2253 /DNA_ORIENTATION=-